MQFASLNRIKSATALFPFAIIALALNGKIENDFCLFLLKTIAPSNALIFRDWVLCSLRFDLGKNRGNFGTIILFLEVSNVVLENNCILTKRRFLDTFKPGDKMIGLVTKTCGWCVNLFSITKDFDWTPYVKLYYTLFNTKAVLYWLLAYCLQIHTWQISQKFSWWLMNCTFKTSLIIWLFIPKKLLWSF